jgi:5'(3')-deoxyribonucleotidase
LTGRPRAGLDLDNVLYDWERHARLLLSLWWKVELPVSREYDSIRKAVGKEKWDWLFDEGVRRFGLFRTGSVLPDAAIEVQSLAATHDLVILTRRPRHAVRDTHEWLAEHLIYPSEVVIFHELPYQGAAVRQKGEVPCDWYVDDSPEEVEDLEERGKRVFLMDRPWNQECRAGERVANWHELMGRL